MDLPHNPSAEGQRREVTDPVTHLPIEVHNATDYELSLAWPPTPIPPLPQRKDQEGGKKEEEEDSDEMVTLVREEVRERRWIDSSVRERQARVKAAMSAAGATIAATILGLRWAVGVAAKGGAGFPWIDIIVGVVWCFVFGTGAGAVVWISTATTSKDKTQQPQTTNEKGSRPESVAWLNSFLSSLWPIVNPALFKSVADMLEDAMQASLPKLVRGVRVAELGQGSESMRILGIRWLEPGDAAEAKQGMPGEDGDFANFEVTIAYRARPAKDTGKGGGLRKRSHNAHLLIEFWSVGDLKLPVWVGVIGVLATARARVQLTPNPPFVSLMTLTLLGQPKINVSCVPIAKNFLDVMDMPFLNRFLQNSIDAAVADYVAPHSLTLDLKTLLTSREKMDTNSVGIVFVRVIEATGFKNGDGSKKWLYEAKRRGDPYVTVGWGKWGKGIWSTRVIENEGEPRWDETGLMLVGPTEIAADENLRLQLWDSDRTTADDLLGILEISLRDTMTQPVTRNCTLMRDDVLVDYEGKPCPGKLRWEIGYFEKTGFEECLAKNGEAGALGTTHRIEEQAVSRPRVLDGLGGNRWLEQQKQKDVKDRADEIIGGSPPNEDFPSGILFIGIEQITGLEIENIRNSQVKEGPEDEEGDDLPSAYCNIIINHQNVYKTRVKLKDNKPFFDAHTERPLRDWRTTTLIISVRDQRTHESDPLLGIVVLPLQRTFSSRSQLTSLYPIVGGIGRGRLRLSLIFRSVYLDLPPQLLGWNTGTLEILPDVLASDDLPMEQKQCHLVFRTLYGRRKMFPDTGSLGNWSRKQPKHTIKLAVCKRYGSCLLVQFRKHSIGLDTASAFCVLWFKDVVDDEEMDVDLPVRRGDMRRAVKSVCEEGEIIGTLKLRIRLWPGLSGYHHSVAWLDRNIADVMEVLAAAEDAREIENMGATDTPSSSSSSSSSYSSEDEDWGGGGSGKWGVGDIREYKRKHKDLHRRHRGMMQFRAARKIAWVGRGVVEKGHAIGDGMKARFKRSLRQPGGGVVETEV